MQSAIAWCWSFCGPGEGLRPHSQCLLAQIKCRGSRGLSGRRHCQCRPQSVTTQVSCHARHQVAQHCLCAHAPKSAPYFGSHLRENPDAGQEKTPDFSGASMTYGMLPAFAGLEFGRGSRIRTDDHQSPRLVRYQAALYPERSSATACTGPRCPAATMRPPGRSSIQVRSADREIPARRRAPGQRRAATLRRVSAAAAAALPLVRASPGARSAPRCSLPSCPARPRGVAWRR
jgi:hypothetical protein